MENILIIKTNASGDVLRTTVLLHVLKGNIFWITAGYNIPLFPDRYPNLTLVPLESIPSELFDLNFDLIINLEEDVRLAQMVSPIKANKTIGVFWKNDKLDYTPESAEWFNMSLISHFPTSHSDELKKNNKSSYQEILYRILGESFSGQKYILYKKNHYNITEQFKIGIEKRAGSTWPNKNWHGYEELKQILKNSNNEIIVFNERNRVRDYMEEIQECSLLICGDTLAMHIAISYEIPCIAIFNCTSPHEIYDYGVLKKIVSPLLLKCFYKRERLEEVINSISVTEVFEEVKKQI